jgi:glycerol kinase
VDYILAIDQGTTGTRVCAYDKQGCSVASAYQEFPQYFPQPGWVEHDPDEIWQSVLGPMREVVRQIRSGSIAAIGITNQRETTVVWDKDSGQPIHNAIVWQCRRTAQRCDELTQSERGLIRDKTGLPIDAYFSATKIEWMLNNVPGALENAKRGKLLFGTIDSWILWKLTGGKVHATDFTNASRTMLFNIETLQWDDDLLERFAIPSSMLPEVRQSSGVFGHTVAIGDLPAGIPIRSVAGDQQAALFGQACFAGGTSKCTYGTGSFLLLNAGKARPVSNHGLIVTIACGSEGEPVYALEGAVFVAGAAIQWLRDGLRILPSAAESERMAESITDNGGVYFVPALAGLGAPYWGPGRSRQRVRPDAGHHCRPYRAGRAGGDVLSDQRCARCDAEGLRLGGAKPQS